MTAEPSLARRLAEREHGVASAAMHQHWRQLAFFHWRWDAAELQARLPAGLHVDTHEGTAWLGVVPFFMDRIRPRFLPPLPWVSWFLELNVRTYVHDDEGRPGVWFFSLDCNQPLAVRIARWRFRLPYHDARMSARQEADGRVRYRCTRKGRAEDAAFDYRLAAPLPKPEPGSLEFFLVERYLLFAQTSRGLRMGRVQHVPYPLARLELADFSEAPLAWNRFVPHGRPPDQIIGSPGVQVRVGSLEVL